MKDEDFAVARGEIDQAGLGVKCSRIHVIADGSGEDDFPSIRIEHGEVLAPASDEETPIFDIHGKAGGCAAGRKRPMVFYLQCVHVDV